MPTQQGASLYRFPVNLNPRYIVTCHGADTFHPIQFSNCRSSLLLAARNTAKWLAQGDYRDGARRRTLYLIIGHLYKNLILAAEIF